MRRKFFLLTLLVFVSSFLVANDQKNSLIETYIKKSDLKLINIVIKDNIDIKDKVTSAGSLALKDNIAKKNAFIVDKLIEANYFIFGKANLSEWANFRSENSVSGWSSFGGQTKHILTLHFASWIHMRGPNCMRRLQLPSSRKKDLRGGI